MKKIYCLLTYFLEHKEKLNDLELEKLNTTYNVRHDPSRTEDKETALRWFEEENKKPTRNNVYRWEYPVAYLAECLEDEETGEIEDYEIIAESMRSFQKDLELQELIESYGDLDELTVEKLKELKEIVEVKSEECIEKFECDLDYIESLIYEKTNE